MEIVPYPNPLPRTRWVSLRTAFFTGLFLLAPLGVSVFVVNLLLARIGEPASEIFFGWINLQPGSGVAAYALAGVSVLIVVALITALGYASHYLFGQWMLRVGENLILRVPFVSQVYRTTKQIVDTFHSQNKAVFDKVVMIEFPRAGLYSIGFLTKPTEGEVRVRGGANLVNVFIPTTPNPTSGFLVICPAKDLIILEMSVGDGMKLIISGGAVTPPYPNGAANRAQT